MAISDQAFERTIALKRMPLFRDLPLDLLLTVAEAIKASAWARGDPVIRAGSTRRGLLVLETGKLSIGGAELAAPTCFGEMTLAGETMSWPGISALEESTGGFLDGLLFDELRGDHPELVVQLCRHLARRLRHLEPGGRLVDLTTALPSHP